jgi:hypothetical protein
MQCHRLLQIPCAAHAYWRSMTSLDAALCSNCQERPVGHDLLCGFDDWCSVCDDELWKSNPAGCGAALCSNCKQRPIGLDLLCGYDDWCSVCDSSLWSTNPAVISVTQSRSFRRFEHPPYSRSYLELLRELRQLERALKRAQEPQQFESIIIDANVMRFRMSVFGDCGLGPTVSHLCSRALVASLQHVYLIIRRCAELADECRAALYGPHPQPQPSYEVMALAVLAADAVCQYLHPDLRLVFSREIRPMLVSCMQDSDSDSEFIQNDDG